MFSTKLTIATAVLLALAVLGTASITYSVLAETIGKETALAKPTADGAGDPAAREDVRTSPEAVKTPEVVGTVVAVAPDGKSFTLEIPGRAQGGKAQRIEVKIGTKTKVAYHAVGPDQARPTVGYDAWVRPGSGAQEVAAGVNFRGLAFVRTVDDSGTVVGVAPDGKGITLESVAPGGAVVKRVAIQFNNQTSFVYSFIAPGGAKPTVGYDADVILADGPQGNTAEEMHFNGRVLAGPWIIRGGKKMDRTGQVAPAGPPDLTGTVSAVAPDGKTITLKVPARARAEKPKQVTIKLTEQIPVVFQSVSPGAAKPTVGYRAHVWRDAASPDRILQVQFIGIIQRKKPQLIGKMVGISPDEKTITLEQPRGEPKRVAVHLTDKTRLSYFNVGPNQAKMTQGYDAQVWLIAESKDTAAQVEFTKPGGEQR